MFIIPPMMNTPTSMVRLMAVGLVAMLCGCTAMGQTASSDLRWVEGDGYVELVDARGPLVRYMHAHDDSSVERRFETSKPYLHVFDADGRDVITNDDPEALYPHHRGIFIGWNRLTHESGRFDLWHMRQTATSQTHEDFAALEASGNRGRLVSIVHWNSEGRGNPLVVEKREFVVRRTAEGIVIDQHSTLKAMHGEVYLDGDSEHAGIHFRAHQNLAEQVKAGTGEAIYTFHKDGLKLERVRNIEEADPATADLPWVTMSYTLGDHTYHVQKMNHPDNPKNTFYSAYRDYGRFGAFFKHRIADGQTLDIRYRFRITTGEQPTRGALDAAYAKWAGR